MRQLIPGTLVGGVAALAVTLAGCGGDDSETPRASTAEAIATVVGGDLFDYEPAEGPAELEQRADLVVRGTVEGFAPGPVYGGSADEPLASTSAVMSVRVDEILEGELPAGAEDRVYVQFFGATVSAADEAAPEAEPTLLYLSVLPEPQQITPGELVDNANSGRPQGQPLFGATTPQGVLVETDDGVAQPIESTEFPDATLEDVGPSEDEFPEEEVTTHP